MSAEPSELLREAADPSIASWEEFNAQGAAEDLAKVYGVREELIPLLALHLRQLAQASEFATLAKVASQLAVDTEANETGKVSVGRFAREVIGRARRVKTDADETSRAIKLQGVALVLFR